MKPAIYIIDEVFGGIRPMGRAIEIPHSTVASWRKQGQIPVKHHQMIFQIAQAKGLTLTPADFFEKSISA